MMIALFLLAAAAGPSQPHGPTATTNPATWFSSDDYPASAMRAHEEGAVRFTLQISASGSITGCKVEESSGFADLDGQTCALAMKHGSFSPAVDKRGRPIASVFTQRTRWVLPADNNDASDMLFGPWMNSMNLVSASATISVDAEGKVLGCKLTRAANTTVDPCVEFPIGKAIVMPSIIDGKPVPATVTAVTMISVKPQK